MGGFKEAAQHLPTAKRLQDVIHSWTNKRHLSAEWFLDACWRIVFVWGYTADRSEEPPWYFPGDYIAEKPDRLPRQLQLPVPTMRQYNPIGETHQGYLELVNKSFDAYCKQQERLYLALGFQETKRPRSPVRQWRYIDWFIMYQVQGMSCATIAERDEAEVDDSTVYKGLTTAAKRLGLPLRSRSRRIKRNLK